MRHRNGLPRHSRGVSLIELMVVVMVVAILAAIGVPSYQNYVVRVKRTDAKTQLLAVAQQLERCYTRDITYLNCVTFPITVPVGATGTDITYRINNPGGALTQNTFTITATRQNGQTRDTACGELSVNERGVRAASAGTAADCW
jgi:type IV pilus assembly protein PilE